MSDVDVEVDRFRRRNRQFAFAASAVIAGICVIVLATLVVVVLRGHTMRIERIQRLALSWSPTLCYLWALWALRGMFLALARGGLSFRPEVIAALGQVGWALGLGGLLTLVETPLIVWLTKGPGVGGFAIVNVPALTLGVTALALVALARMLRRGVGLEAEAAKLKAVLEDFI
jgi:hypothetical protein